MRSPSTTHSSRRPVTTGPQGSSLCQDASRHAIKLLISEIRSSKSSTTTSLTPWSCGTQPRTLKSPPACARFLRPAHCVRPQLMYRVFTYNPSHVDDEQLLHHLTRLPLWTVALPCAFILYGRLARVSARTHHGVTTQ